MFTNNPVKVTIQSGSVGFSGALCGNAPYGVKVLDAGSWRKKYLQADEAAEKAKANSATVDSIAVRLDELTASPAKAIAVINEAMKIENKNFKNRNKKFEEAFDLYVGFVGQLEATTEEWGKIHKESVANALFKAKAHDLGWMVKGGDDVYEYKTALRSEAVVTVNEMQKEVLSQLRDEFNANASNIKSNSQRQASVGRDPVTICIRYLNANILVAQ